MFESIDDLKTISDDQWKQMNFPMGLINRIKKKLEQQPS